jgi:phosphoribosyl 1,2-cyclic phosphodiesterase/ActR/RegA family two-component response regulator
MDKIVIVDDDPDIVMIAAKRLRAAGYEVSTAGDGEAGLLLIQAERPSVVLLDLMMPKVHGFTVCQEIRKDSKLDRTRIIVTSAKSYPVDVAKAKELGADVYLMKPYDLEEVVETVKAAVLTRSSTSIKFWGTRGSIATPGPATMRYGGNTSCVEMRCGDTILMLDCGTGAREMGNSLAQEFAGRALEIHLFISHTHWDHIQGFPFFAPAYMPNSKITVYSARGCDKPLDRIFTGQMDASYFPVAMSDLAATLRFIELDGDIVLGDTKIEHMFLNHPGIAVGFRIHGGGKTISYLTDHEVYCRMRGDLDHYRKLDEQVNQFAADSDLYIREAQYTDEEYPKKKGWGHSTASDAVKSAVQARARQLALYHHDPMHDDHELDRIVAGCRTQIQEYGVNLACFAAADGQRLHL